MLNFDTTRGMDRDAIDAFLREQASGVLSLAHDGDAYAVPEAFGYDGEDVYFKFGYHDESKKIRYLTHTDRAAFVVYDVSAAGFRSVIASGPVRKVPDDLIEDAIAVVDEQHPDGLPARDCLFGSKVPPGSVLLGRHHLSVSARSGLHSSNSGRSSGIIVSVAADWDPKRRRRVSPDGSLACTGGGSIYKYGMSFQIST